MKNFFVLVLALGSMNVMAEKIVGSSVIPATKNASEAQTFRSDAFENLKLNANSFCKDESKVASVSLINWGGYKVLPTSENIGRWEIVAEVTCK